jgi:hypothetical protein
MKINIKNRWADTIHPDPYKKIKFAIQLALCSYDQNCDWDIDVEQICDTKDVRLPHTYHIIAERVSSLSYENGDVEGTRTYQDLELYIRPKACAIMDIVEAVTVAMTNFKVDDKIQETIGSLQ